MTMTPSTSQKQRKNPSLNDNIRLNNLVQRICINLMLMNIQAHVVKLTYFLAT